MVQIQMNVIITVLLTHHAIPKRGDASNCPLLTVVSYYV